MIDKPTTEHIKDIVQTAHIMREPAVSFLAEGYGNFTFLLQENDRKLVFRHSKNSEPQFSDSLASEYILLRYLHATGIECVPKAIYYHDATHPGLI